MKKWLWIFLAINIAFGFLIYSALEIPEPAIVHLNGEAGNIYLLPNETYFPVLRKKISESQREIPVAAFLFKTDAFRTNWAKAVLDELIEAKNRGVKLEVFLDRQDVSSPFYSPDLARINEQTMLRLKDAGVRVIMDSPTKTTHCKVVVIDCRFVFVGSHNLTSSGLFSRNNELSVLIDSPSLAEEVITYLDRIQNENPS